MGRKKNASRDQGTAAIVGLSLRLPKSPDSEALMDNLETGFDAIAEIPAERWSVAAHYDPDPSTPGKSISKWCGLLDGIEGFDNRFFNLAPAEAAIMDPQQRLLLEEVWRCVENSGLGFDRLRRIRTGLYVGFMATDFLQVLAAPDLETRAGHALGGYACGLANRVSHILGLSGPSVPMDAACASSLVALHHARKALLDGEVDAAIVAGVSLNLTPWKYVSFSKARMLSPTGRCRAFDAAADGYVPGDGVAAVLLLRAGEARKAGATIHALVRGSAVNHCGDSAFITAPSVAAQEDVIAQAIAQSGVPAEHITYVEAHGTGTSLGDPIEVEGLRRAFARFTARTGFARIGSIKSNIGHLEGAAGLAGLAKVVMMMRRRTLVPTANLATINPVIDFARTPVSPALAREEWRPARPGAPLAAGISSFGMGGANAHAVLTSDIQPPRRRKKAEPPGLFLLSARSPEALDQMAERWRGFARTGDGPGNADICGTLATGRAAFRHRAGMVLSPGDSPAEAVPGLRRAEIPSGPWSVFLGDAAGVAPHQGRSGTLDGLYRKALPKGKPWEDSDPRIQGLRHSLAVLGALERLGFKPQRLAGNGSGLWAALVASGQITKSEAVRALRNPKAARRTRPRRPKIPFFDPVAGQWRQPMCPDADYVRALVEGLRASAARLAELARPIRPLADHQPTFQRFLAQWGDPEAPAPADRELIQSLALRDARRQLGQRWHLSQAPDHLDPRAAEAEALVDAGVLRRDTLVRLLGGADPAEVAAQLAQALAGHPHDDRFPLLATWGEGEFIGDLADWTTRVEHAAAPLTHGAAAHWLVLGGSSAPSGLATVREPLPLTARLPEALCLDLWLGGIDLDWDKVFPDRSFRRTELPGTVFQHNTFPIGRAGLMGDAPSPPPPVLAALPSQGLYRPDWVREPSSPAAAFETVVILGADGARRAEWARPFARTGTEVRSGGLDMAISPPPAGRWALILLLPEDVEDADALLDGPAREVFEILKRLETAERLTLATVAPVGLMAGLAAGWLAALAAEQAFGAVRTVEMEGGDPGLLPDLLAAASGFGRMALRPDGAWRFTLAERQAPSPAPARSLTGTWVVTGGAGALGLRAAEALAARGAETVLLLGRRQTSPRPLPAYPNTRIAYRACDVTSAASLAGVLDEARGWGPIRGVIHGAGILDDHLFRHKTWDGFRAVLAPKLAGAWHLDRLTRADPLVLFAVQASVVGVLGNAGQTDYAAANAALDALIHRRAAESAPGRSLALDWGLWRGGAGMGDADTERWFEQMGLPPLEPVRGDAILGAALDLPLEGQWIALGGAWARPASAPSRLPPAGPLPAGKADAGAIARYLTGRIAAFTGQGPDRIAADDSFFELGVGSVQLMDLTQDLSRHFSGVTPTLPFQHGSIARMAAFLAAQTALEPLPGQAAPPSPPAVPASPARGTAVPARRETPSGADAVAIIGMAGRYPDSADLSRFWQALAQGRDCVRPAPPERWQEGATARVPPGQRGGWLAEVDTFDPLFFNISFREAEQMDPQQRLMLEVAWEALEHAGYARRDRRAASSIGLFAGVMWNEYSLHAREHRERSGTWGGPGSLYWAIANRVSYALDLTGPSMAVDTACSSSLTALHLAAQAIATGDCDMALAGGVNLSIHPAKFDYLREGRFLSSEGLCRSFGEGGDGYVPGEGVGAVLLKPLARALADGDTVHGVIRGTSANHGGRAAGFTVPNPTAQAALIRRALDRAGVSPVEIGYVECHGTGTALGDPIEIAALAEAFGPDLPLAALPIGSVKSNIGHLEAAAGIAALSKVLLSLSHGFLPQSLHAGVKNSRIDFAATPFRVLDAGEPWRGPRRAAISSFGAGGSNAHAVIEAAPPLPDRAPAAGTWVFPLSARTRDSLERFALALNDALSGLDLRDVAHSLQIGREVFDVRAAVLAGDHDTLAAALGALGRGEDHPALWRGRAEDGTTPPAVDGTGLAPRALAEAWASGAALIWPPMAEGRMVGLPGYCFARERYWIGGATAAATDLPRGLDITLSPENPLVAHHVVGGRRILPAAGGLEMMRAALSDMGRPAAQLLDLAWTRPVVVADTARTVTISVGETEGGLLPLSLGDEDGVSVRAKAGTEPPAPIRESIPATDRGLDPAEAYQAFARLGLAYGPGFQAIRELRLGDGVAVARLESPQTWDSSRQGTILPPALVDAGLQTALALLAPHAYLPVSMERAAWWKPIPPRVTAVVRLTPGEGRLRHMDVRFLDQDGTVVAALDRVGLLRVDLSALFPPVAALAFSREAWKEADAPPAPPAPVLVIAPAEALEGWRHAAMAHGLDREGMTLLDRARPERHPPAPLAGRPLRVLFEAGAEDDGKALLAWTQALMAAGLQKVELVAAYASPAPGARPLCAALGGFARSVRTEHPDYNFRVTEVVEDGVRPWRDTALDEFARTDVGSTEVRLIQGRRLIRVTETVPVPPGAPFAADPDGVHLVTGGLGGLGLLFAGWLADKGAGRIALLGRSAPSAEAQAEIDALAARGVAVLVTLADLSRPGEAERAVVEITAQLGPVVGIIHSAGVTRDALIPGKRAEDWDRVLAPKVAGTLALDRATQGLPLGYFALFASISGILGNPGQADYAFANRFMDAFAEWREDERKAGRRRGRTLAVDWPLWRTDRGMGAGLDAATLAAIRDAMGTEALTPSQGLAAFETALGLDVPQVLVTLPVQARAMPAQAASTRLGAVPPLQAALAYVKDRLRAETRIPAERIGSRQSFEEFGIDSVMVVNLTRALEADFGPLPKTLFFEYRTPAALAAHLAEARPEVFQTAPPPQAPAVAVRPAPDPVIADDAPIAVIGLAGRYPQAPDLEAFWRNLKDGVDAITDVPPERWDHAALFDPDGRDNGAVYGKWGGFIDGIDLFDPLTFGISPKDARLIDPQERLFLETARHALEDAGYASQSLSGATVGVFAGAMWGQYELLGAGVTEGPVPASSFAGIANRVSFCLNLTGPSLTVDTMCSSSLTALHLAMESLRRGECTMALAGGVNLTIDSNKYRQLAQGRFLSTDGRCRSFGEGGDGYVPGEGVGVAVLKPLSQAQADGDRILAVLRGNAINHGGRGNGFTVPDVTAQAGAVAGALKRSGIPAESISYLETHGTGTALGDPIEIAGLAKAFNAAGVPADWRCAIGSAKSAIGHLEAAAGIAGLTKLVLQLGRRQLTPSLHADTLNPNIQWDRIPFHLQRRAAPWVPAPGPDGRPWPRRAGLSSFGAGGSNAHLVVEEYIAPAENPAETSGPVLLPLSARTPQSLRQSARLLLSALSSAPSGTDREKTAIALLAEVLGTGEGDISAHDSLADLGVDQAALFDWIGRLNARFGARLTLERCAAAASVGAIAALLPEASSDSSPRLADMAFTLQTGREPMAERLALVVRDAAQARAILEAFLADHSTAGLHQGRALHAPADAEIRTARAVAARDLDALAALWVEGAEIPWQALHGAVRHRRMQLPLYPYDRQPYWYQRPGEAPKENTMPASPSSASDRDEAARLAQWEARARSWTGDCVRLETVDGEIALVTLQDRANRNMFSDDLVLGLVKSFVTIREEARHKVVIVTGADGIFSMGATPQILTDIAESRARFSDIPFMYRGLLDCEVPVIAAIQGHASGGGLLFGLYADMVLMAEESLFSAVFTRYGFTPGMGATLILKERLGANVATRMMYTGQSFTGTELKALGAQVTFAPAAAVGEQALALARGLTDKPRETLKTLKRELAGRILSELPAVIATELAMHAATFGSDEVRSRIGRLTRQPEAEAAPPPAAPEPLPPASPPDRVRLRPLTAPLAAALPPAATQPVRLVPLADPAVAPPAARVHTGDIANALIALLGRTLQMEAKDVPCDVPFLDLGLDSIGGVELVHAINARFGTRLEAADLYDHPTVQQLTTAVCDRLPAAPVAATAPQPQPVPPPPTMAETVPEDAVAVIGMACRYPGADDTDALWDLLLAGADRVSEIPADRWTVSGFYDPDPEAEGRCVSKWGGFLDDVAGFDAEFFGLSPMEAEIMDPQQRLVLEECLHALENAALAADSLSNVNCGVFMGAAAGDYEDLVRRAGQDGTAHAFLGLSPSILSARIAYHLNLKGPCLAMDTACSSSLVAVHEACRSLKDGESDLALAGGVVVMATPRLHLRSGKTGMLSPTGRCRPFDAQADGIALAEGVGVVVLKRLSQALADGDPIRAVIRGSGINQDGRTNGITAPSARSQAELEARVLERAQVAAASIGYVETHGTGTPLGDPIEVKALAETFRDSPPGAKTCALGSVKANLGHATVAAGIAGLIKAVLCVEAGVIPPMPHFRQANPRIDFGATPFFINGESIPWPQPGPRRAAVSAFGFSGTNAHVVLEQAPARPGPADLTAPVLVPLSARTATALAGAVHRLARVLTRSDAPALADVARTLILGRQTMAERAAFLATDRDDLIRQLKSWTPQGPNGPLQGPAQAWAEGAGIDLRPLAPQGRRIALPGYEFDHQRHWLSPARATAAPQPPGHPLIAVREADGFSARFSGDEFFLADHRATGRRILPATAFLEMAVAAQLATTGRAPAGLAELGWSVPVEERDGTVPPVRLRLKDGGFAVTTTLDGAEETACTGLVLTAPLTTPHTESPEAIAKRCPGRVAGAGIYDAFAAKGLIHGPSFRWVDEVLLGRGEVLVRLRPLAEDAAFTLHPGQLDAALQGVVLLIDPDLRDQSLYLPVRMARVSLHGDMSGAAWVHITPSPDQSGGKEQHAFDVRIMDGSGRLVVAVDGFTLRRVERVGATTLFLSPVWRDQALTPPAKRQGRVLLVTDDAALSAAAAARGLDTALPGAEPLSAEAGEAILALAGDDPAPALTACHRLASQLLRRDGRTRLLLASLGSTGGPDLGPAMAGFLRSLMTESERISPGTLSLGSLGADAALDALLAELAAPAGCVARIADGRRQVTALAEMMAGDATAAPWREGGHYLITGGMGRLGLALAEDLARRHDARLTLVGRRPADPAALAAITQAGGAILPLAADITTPGGAQAVVAQAKARFGAVHGVIHAAGLLRDARLTAKPLDDALAVLAPKIAIREVDRVLAGEKLDLMVLFSSLAAAQGWPGQSDYAFANGWLDAFALWRDAECRAGRRFGRTVSIQWPYWAAGGMAMDSEMFETAARQLGVVPLSIPDGLAALDASLATDRPVIMPLVGNASVLRRHFLAAPDERTQGAPESAPTELAGRLYARLSAEVTELLKLPAARIGPERRLSEYGFDSITLTRFANRLNRQFGLNLSPALFFERPTLAALGEALLERHGAAMAAHFGAEKAATPAASVIMDKPAVPAATADDPIAIVGMAGMMPGSPDLDAFWAHLAACDDLITEIPPDRWDWRRHASLPGASKWGAFLEGVDLFDAGFFGISPREAELMDPQQRLFLETVWHAIEDSGQRPEDLAGSDTGLFVGVATSDYWELLQASGIAVEAHTATGNSHSVLPNRISYLLDLRGPSEPVDTACSSSLVALARAADAIRRGDCGMAIVGGVNVMLTPSLYVAFGKAGMLSPDGRCKTFDQSADGYVRGEGVGAVVLKPLSRALADGNRVHALLRGWAVNHGGRAASLTAPNPNAQAQVIRAALGRAGIDPATISYVEAHGTGTPLGDPVEVEGLKMVFRGEDRPPCWLGSVKSAIGHLEAAAGIAGLIKVLLAMRHRTLPGNGLLKTLNPHIHLEGSPLRVLSETRPWDGEGPLRAGLSSFGFGGANAHVVVESFEGAEAPRLPARPPTPFQRRRHWPKAARAAVAPPQAESPPPPVEKMLFAPQWVSAPMAATARPAAGGVLVVAEDQAGIDAVTALLGRHHSGSALEVTPLDRPSISEGLRHVHILLAPEAAGDGSDDPATGDPLPLRLFRLLKHLLARGYAERELAITLVATGAVAPPVHRPAAAACFALMRAVGREQGRWAVRCLDLDPASTDPAADLAELLDREDGAEDFGAPLAMRDGQARRRILRPSPLPAAPSPWVPRGTYVIVGGAGGVGGVLARRLAREAKAGVALIGRRAPDAAIADLLAAIARDGGNGLYLQADAADAPALEESLAEVERTLGPIHGMVHAAMTLDDQAFAAMTEEAFLAPLRAKAAVAQALVRAAANRESKLIFFSSVQTLLCNAGQANYAAGCAWQDAMADRLAAEGRPVQVIQWGYWGEVGAVATPAHRARMAKLGIGSIGAAEGMAALERMMAGGVTPLLVAHATPAALAALGVVDEDDLPPSHLPAALAALEQATQRATLTALAQAGAFDPAGGWLPLDQVRAALGVIARQERLFAAVIDMLAATPFLDQDGERLRLTLAGREAAEGHNLDADLAEAARRHPAIAPHMALLGHCIQGLAAVLSGRRQGTDILLPGGSMALIEPIYRGNEIADRQNRAVAAWIGREVATRLDQDGGPLRLVEIGAGTGGTSAFVLDTLAAHGDDVGYWYTDVSKAFLQHGWRLFHPSHAFTRFEVLDITRPPPQETFPRHSYDIALAANVLHAVPDIRAGISHVAQLLKGGGCLILNELTAIQSFNTVTFGQLDGWWAAGDAERRLANTPLLSLAGWRRELGEAGFSVERVRDDGLGLTVLLARCQRQAAPAAAPAERPAVKTSPAFLAGSDTVQDTILDTLAGVLLMDRAEIDPARSYVDHGVDSILAVETANQLNDRLGIQLRPTDLFNHPTVERLARHIAQNFDLAAPSTESSPTESSPARPDGDGGNGGDDPLMQVLLSLQRGDVSVEEAEALLELTS